MQTVTGRLLFSRSIYLFSCAGSSFLHRLSLAAVSGSFSSVAVYSLLVEVALGITGSRGRGLSAVVQGLATLWPVGSFWTRDQIHAPYIGRQILNHWTTREVPSFPILKMSGSSESLRGSSRSQRVYMAGPRFKNRSVHLGATTALLFVLVNVLRKRLPEAKRFCCLRPLLSVAELEAP